MLFVECVNYNYYYVVSKCSIKGWWGKSAVKEFIYSIIVVAVISLMVELFCPAKVMKKPLYLALTLISLFIIVDGSISLLTNSKKELVDFEFNLTEFNNPIFGSIVSNTESNIMLALTQNGAEVEKINLEYVVDEFQINYQGCKVKVKSAENEKQYKELVSNLTGLNVGDVVIYE